MDHKTAGFQLKNTIRNTGFMLIAYIMTKKIKAYLISFAGFSGQYCETEMNECDSAPCLNGAVCQNDVNSYDCFCPEGKLFKIIYFYYL